MASEKLYRNTLSYTSFFAEKGDKRCVKMLRGLLRNPPNNTIININIRLSEARYRCRGGFMLEGNERRSCFRGRWVEKEQPKCTGNSFLRRLKTFIILTKFIILSFTPPRNSMSIPCAISALNEPPPISSHQSKTLQFSQLIAL